MTTEKEITLAIADDHPYFRKGLSEILSAEGNFRILVEAGDGGELLEKLSGLECLPDICLMDIRMPGLNGYDTTTLLKAKWPSLKVIALSMYDHEFTIINIMKRGAAAFLTKAGDPAELFIALNEVHEKGFYHSNLEDEHITGISDNSLSIKKLTPKEKEFLSYCCSDLTYEQIAKLMCVSVHTIDGYRTSLFQKLAVTSRVGLVLFALQTGMA